MKLFLKLFIALAATGLFGSFIVHLCALLRNSSPFGQYDWALHMGVFVVFFPAIIVTNTKIANQSFKRKDFWKVALNKCPRWMRLMVPVFFIYAIFNFAFFFLRTIGTKSGKVNSAIELQGFSGYWMAFYAVALALLYAATQHEEIQCPNGHVVSPVTKFCEQCGAALN